MAKSVVVFIAQVARHWIVGGFHLAYLFYKNSGAFSQYRCPSKRKTARKIYDRTDCRQKHKIKQASAAKTSKTPIALQINFSIIIAS
jgi:hypothetical protein